MSQMIDDEPAGDGEQPCAEAMVRAVFAHAAPGAKEGLLRQVLGVGMQPARAEPPGDEVEQAAFESRDDLCERLQ